MLKLFTYFIDAWGSHAMQPTIYPAIAPEAVSHSDFHPAINVAAETQTAFSPERAWTLSARA